MVGWVKWAPVTFALGLLLGNFTYCSNVADKQTFAYWTLHIPESWEFIDKDLG